MHRNIFSILTRLNNLTSKQTYLLASLVFLISAFVVAAGYFFLSLTLTVILSLLSASFCAILTIGLQKTISEYAQKVSKGELITRRFQNISKYFESILQDSTDIIFSMDTDGYILKFSKGSQLHFGYTQEEIVGKPLSCLFENESDQRKVLSTVLMSGKSVNEEIAMKTKSGETILVDLSMSEMKRHNQIRSCRNSQRYNWKKNFCLNLKRKTNC